MQEHTVQGISELCVTPDQLAVCVASFYATTARCTMCKATLENVLCQIDIHSVLGLFI